MSPIKNPSVTLLIEPAKKVMPIIQDVSIFKLRNPLYSGDTILISIAYDTFR